MGSLVEYCSQQQRPSAITRYSLASSLSTTATPTTILVLIHHEPTVAPWNLSWAQRSQARSKGSNSTTQQQQDLLRPPPYPPSSKMDWANFPHPRNHTPVKDGSSVPESVVTWRQQRRLRLELLSGGLKCGCGSGFA
jgi:hypothetical protein